LASTEVSAALLSRTSTPPNVDTAVSNRSRTDDSSWRSISTARAVEPIAFAVAVAAAMFTSPTTTDAPSEARRFAVAAPIPVAPPTTTATLPSKRFTCSPYT